MHLPQTDASGRFVAGEPRDAALLTRIFAKGIDVFPTGLAVAIAQLAGVPALGLVALSLFACSDWTGSPGKWLLRIRAITLDGSPATPLAALQRNVTLCLAPAGHLVISAGWLGQGRWDQASVFCVGAVVVLGEFVGLLFQPQNRRWGDVFAKTRVVER